MDPRSGGGGAATPLLGEEEGAGGDEENQGPVQAWKGDYVKSMVYAAMDAIVSCFSLISSMSAVRLSSAEVLVLGLANLLADGLSMALGDTLSSKTEKDMASKVKAEDETDITGHIRSRAQDMVRQYEQLGMESANAATVVSILAKYRDVMVNEEMKEQQKMVPPESSQKSWKNGAITFVSALVFGAIPLLSFIALIPFTTAMLPKFSGACCLTAVALTLLGLCKAKISGESYRSSVPLTLFNGAVAAAAAAAYSAGYLLRSIAGI